MHQPLAHPIPPDLSRVRLKLTHPPMAVQLWQAGHAGDQQTTLGRSRSQAIATSAKLALRARAILSMRSRSAKFCAC